MARQCCLKVWQYEQDMKSIILEEKHFNALNAEFSKKADEFKTQAKRVYKSLNVLWYSAQAMPETDLRRGVCLDFVARMSVSWLYNDNALRKELQGLSLLSQTVPNIPLRPILLKMMSRISAGDVEVYTKMIWDVGCCEKLRKAFKELIPRAMRLLDGDWLIRYYVYFEKATKILVYNDKLVAAFFLQVVSAAPEDFPVEPATHHPSSQPKPPHEVAFNHVAHLTSSSFLAGLRRQLQPLDLTKRPTAQGDADVDTVALAIERVVAEGCQGCQGGEAVLGIQGGEAVQGSQGGEGVQVRGQDNQSTQPGRDVPGIQRNQGSHGGQDNQGGEGVLGSQCSNRGKRGSQDGQVRGQGNQSTQPGRDVPGIQRNQGGQGSLGGQDNQGGEGVLGSQCSNRGKRGSQDGQVRGQGNQSTQPGRDVPGIQCNQGGQGSLGGQDNQGGEGVLGSQCSNRGKRGSQSGPSKRSTPSGQHKAPIFVDLTQSPTTSAKHTTQRTSNATPPTINHLPPTMALAVARRVTLSPTTATSATTTTPPTGDNAPLTLTVGPPLPVILQLATPPPPPSSAHQARPVRVLRPKPRRLVPATEVSCGATSRRQLARERLAARLRHGFAGATRRPGGALYERLCRAGARGATRGRGFVAWLGERAAAGASRAGEGQSENRVVTGTGQRAEGLVGAEASRAGDGKAGSRATTGSNSQRAGGSLGDAEGKRVGDAGKAGAGRVAKRRCMPSGRQPFREIRPQVQNVQVEVGGGDGEANADRGLGEFRFKPYELELQLNGGEGRVGRPTLLGSVATPGQRSASAAWAEKKYDFRARTREGQLAMGGGIKMRKDLFPQPRIE